MVKGSRCGNAERLKNTGSKNVHHLNWASEDYSQEFCNDLMHYSVGEYETSLLIEKQ